MHYTIYKITSIVDDKIYIGKHQTEDVNDSYMGSGILISRAIKKYGKENFTKEILYIFESEEEMNAKEAELVTEDFCSRNDTYNICPGGKGGWGYINQHGLGVNWYTIAPKSNEFLLKKLSEKRKCPTWSLSFSKTISAANKKAWQEGKNKGFTGYTHSDEVKKKIGKSNSEKQSGNKNSQYGTMWITDGLKNKKINKTDYIPKGWKRGRVIKKIV
jgi:hypothetical protein